MSKIQIFVIDEDNDKQEIKDLYWFEENYVHDFNGQGLYENYVIEIYVDDVIVYSSKGEGK